MLTNLLFGVIIILFASFVGWRKYKKHQRPSKYWEGKDPNERKPSLEEMEQEASKYRGFGQYGGPGAL